MKHVSFCRFCDVAVIITSSVGDYYNKCENAAFEICFVYFLASWLMKKYIDHTRKPDNI